MTAASLWLSYQVSDDVTAGDTSSDTVLATLIGLSLAVGAVLLVPIERLWVRWAFNTLVLVFPALVTLALVTNWF